MIQKLLLSKQNYKQLMPVLFGCFFGLLMLLTSLQIYFEIKQLLVGKKDSIGAQYLVINKPVNLLNTISGSRSGFSENEIAELQNIHSVEKIGVFTSNRYQVKAGFEFSGRQMLTDMFFESVSDSFIDIQADAWNWKPGEEIPIILPTDYINLYNFGFAPVQDLPQISKATAQMAGLRITISNNDTVLQMQGRIAGFTDRINSVLVPQEFMNYANSQYGLTEAVLPSRLIIKSSDISDPKLNAILDQNAYEANRELTKSGQLNALLNMVLTVLLMIGGVIVMLALVGFIQYTQLLVNHASDEIKILLQLGYQPLLLLKKYTGFFILLLSIVGVLALVSVFYLNTVFIEYSSRMGFDLEFHINSLVYWVLLLLLFAFALLNTLQIYRLIYKLAKPV